VPPLVPDPQLLVVAEVEVEVLVVVVVILGCINGIVSINLIPKDVRLLLPVFATEVIEVIPVVAMPVAAVNPAAFMLVNAALVLTATLAWLSLCFMPRAVELLL